MDFYQERGWRQEMPKDLGYNKPLFILPFDHRSSFKNLFPNEKSIIEAKEIIYYAFIKAIEQTVPQKEAAILIDEQYGDAIIRDAKHRGITVAIATEKSGQREFSLEYGNSFAEHIEKYKPVFAKALIRYNFPNLTLAPQERNNLQKLSNFCHKNDYKLLLEVLISPENLRINLASKIIEELQKAKIEPDVWKLEGAENENDYKKILEKIQRNGRAHVELVILGRNEDQKIVEKWLSIGAKVKGIIGFAIGRTIFLKPLMDFKDGKIDRETAINDICQNYNYFYKIFVSSKRIV